MGGRTVFRIEPPQFFKFGGTSATCDNHSACHIPGPSRHSQVHELWQARITFGQVSAYGHNLLWFHQNASQ
jgi:hypothetical protein